MSERDDGHKPGGLFTRLFGERKGGTVPPADLASSSSDRKTETETFLKPKRWGELFERKEKPARLTGVITDQRLLTHYFKEMYKEDIVPITTDRFLKKSKEQYGAAWLAREIIQNWVDHNSDENRGTLDGVSIHEETINPTKAMPKGGSRFIVKGNWPLKDNTGIIGLHSEKPEGEDEQSAGGNGIGLKQAALRYLRDFGVHRFTVSGEEWDVDYCMVEKDEMNARINIHEAARGACPVADIKHDWLVGRLTSTKNTGVCSYTIETDDPEISATLRRLHELGVSTENPYLQELDFENEAGCIRWLQPNKDGTEPQGRLFMNGQVMNYRTTGTTTTDYWKGPEQVTIALKNVNYKMNIDRPPVTPRELEKYLERLVHSMTKEELLAQLKKSEYIWSNDKSEEISLEIQGCYVLIQKIVSTLRYSFFKQREGEYTRYDPTEFQSIFGGKKYLARDIRLNDTQKEALLKAGFVLCPKYFADIGMSKASAELGSADAAKARTPQPTDLQLEKLSVDAGLAVGSPDMEYIQTPEELFLLIHETLKTQALQVTAISDSTFTLATNIAIPKNLLLSQLHRAKKGNKEQEVLYFVRGAILCGLQKKIFDRVSSAQGDYVTTYSHIHDHATEQAKLIVLNTEAKTTGDGLTLEFTVKPEHRETFKQIFIDGYVPKPKTDEKSKPTMDDRPTPHDKQATLASEMKKIPSAADPEAPIVSGGVVIKEVPPDQTLVKLAEKFPEIATLVHNIDSIVTNAKREAGVSEISGPLPAEKYLAWRKERPLTEQHTGDAANYIGSKTLGEILLEHSEADTSIQSVHVADNDPRRAAAKEISARLKEITNRISPKEHQVDEFDIVLEPTKEQLQQLGLLRMYITLATEHTFRNDFFVYIGTGSRGINIGQRAIGLHTTLLDVEFSEALRTLIHEIAHNRSMNHDNEFRHTMEALFTHDRATWVSIAQKLHSRETLTEKEEMILNIQQQWNQARRVREKISPTFTHDKKINN